MHLKQIECFLDLSETLNFSETANNLYLTQPAVSHQIKSLEDEIGVPLFKRNKRTVELTEAGISFYDDIKDIYNRINVSIAKTKNLSTKFKSSLYIGYENNAIEMLKIPLIISSFKNLFPKCNVYLNHIEYNEKKVELLFNKYDIIFTNKENIPKSNKFTYFELLLGHPVFIFKKNHYLSKLDYINLEDLANENLIFLNPLKFPGEMSKIQNRLLTQNTNSNIYYSDSIDVSYTMIKSDIGIAVMPNFVAPDNKELIKIPIKINSSFSYGILTLPKNSNKEIKEFISITKKIFKMK